MNKLAFVFPGQGAQAVGMGKDLFDQYDVAKRLFAEADEAANYMTYLKTKFVRFLMLQTITSQDLSPEKFMFVPSQDFTTSSDIDWTQEITLVDQQLYRKYKLTDDEIILIEKTIKPF